MRYKIYSGNEILEMDASEFSSFQQAFTIIQAAGGIVKDEEDRVLFIFRRGKWDLPKGKRDEGESLAECAKREVQEECGIVVDTVNERVYKTLHTYEEKGKNILKETFWYLMKATNKQMLKPQVEEQIEFIEWANEHRQEELLANTYPMIRDLIISVNQKPL